MGFEYTGPPPNPDGQPQESPYPSAGYPPPYGYNGYGYPPIPPADPGYGGSWPPDSPYPMGPPSFRRDGYQFSVAIISTIFSASVIATGIFCVTYALISCCNTVNFLSGATNGAF